jgi:hypothetical protein
MAPSIRVRVPKPAPGSYNPDRPLARNMSLLHQVKHFRELEKRLPPGQQTGMDFGAIKTEGDSGSYTGTLTAVLREHQYQKLIERKYTVGLNPHEEIALRDLTNELSGLDEPFYRPLIERLKARMYNRESKPR